MTAITLDAPYSKAVVLSKKRSFMTGYDDVILVYSYADEDSQPVGSPSELP